jgi:hypothetical protein
LGDATDDLIAIDSSLMMAYTFNGDNEDNVYGIAPPAVGFLALRGPIVFTGNNSDTAVFCRNKEQVRLPRYKDIKFTSMQWIQKSGSLTWREPYRYSETYLRMKGLLNDGSQIIHPNGYTTTFSHTGDPVTNTGWLLQGQADHRFLISTGPVNMAPGDTQVVVIAQIIARGNSNLNSITALRQTAVEVRNYYNSCYNPFPIGIHPIGNEVPNKYQLHQNYPNPFNPVTKVKFDIPKSSLVKLVVYDLLGREVATLVNEELKAGTYEADWDASGFATGVYFYQLVVGENTNNGGTNDFVETKKMVLIK